MIMRRMPTAEDVGLLAIQIEALRRQARAQNCETVDRPSMDVGDPGMGYCSDEFPEEEACTPCLERRDCVGLARKLRAKQLRWITRIIEAKR